jgi:hypothetical protein
MRLLLPCGKDLSHCDHAAATGNFAIREKTKNTALERIDPLERIPKRSNYEVSKND